MRIPHKGTLWVELSRHFGKEMEGAVKLRAQETKSRRFYNSPGPRKHMTPDPFNEPYALLALFSAGFLAPWRTFKE
jgi:hypothetical protein